MVIIAGSLMRGPPARAQTDEAALKDDRDAALERVLRSGCRDGLPEVRALAGAPDAPWAATVTRLCDGILREGATAPLAAPAASRNDGRGALVLWSSLYGIWLGIAGDVLLDINGTRSVIIPPMIGLGATLVTSLWLTSEHPVTSGQAWTIITGLDYASIDGALWGGALNLSAKGVVALALGTSAAATAAATWVAVARRPKAGDIELVRSWLLWGTTAGLLGVAAIGPSDVGARTAWAAGAIAMDVSLGAGIALASRYDLSRSRLLIIDAGAIAGGLAGFGISWLVVGGASANGRAVAGGTLGGLIAGIGLAALATRRLDAPEAEARALPFPALLARDTDGHWTVSVPSATPILNAAGTRPAGASITAVGGLF